MAEHRKRLRDPDMIAAAAALPPEPEPAPLPARRTVPTFTPRQYAGAAMVLVLGVVWALYELHGEKPPPGIGQGLVVALALVTGKGAGGA